MKRILASYLAVVPQATVRLMSLCVMLSPIAAMAQDWSFNPDIELTYEYDDNARLRTDEADQNQIRGGELDARARIQRKSPTGQAVFSPRVRTSNYPDDAEFESDDYFFDFDSKHNAEKSIWTFNARYSAEQIRTAELEDPDFDNPDIDRPIIDDSGVVQIKDKRNRITVSPSVRFVLSPRTDIEIAGDYIDTSYDDNVGGLVDYTFGNVEFNVIRKLSERAFFGVKVFGGRYEADQNNVSTDSVGIATTFNRQLSTRNSGSFYIGYQDLKSDFLLMNLPESSSEGVFIAGAKFTRHYELSDLVLDLQHSTNPSGIGQVTERTQFRVSLTRQLSPLVSGNITVRLLQEDSIAREQVIARPDRDLNYVSAKLIWRLNQNWALIGSYRFARQEFVNTAEDASSNAFSLGIRYAPPRRN